MVQNSFLGLISSSGAENIFLKRLISGISDFLIFWQNMAGFLKKRAKKRVFCSFFPKTAHILPKNQKSKNPLDHSPTSREKLVLQIGLFHSYGEIWTHVRSSGSKQIKISRTEKRLHLGDAK